MPKLKTPDRTATAVRAWNELENLQQWHRSHRGNLTRAWEGQQLTIFSRRGEYRWCRAFDESEPEFSCEGFETEKAAVANLAEFVAREIYELEVV